MSTHTFIRSTTRKGYNRISKASSRVWEGVKAHSEEEYQRQKSRDKVAEEKYWSKHTRSHKIHPWDRPLEIVTSGKKKFQIQKGKTSW